MEIKLYIDGVLVFDQPEAKGLIDAHMCAIHIMKGIQKENRELYGGVKY